jgi:hypothetical protein
VGPVASISFTTEWSNRQARPHLQPPADVKNAHTGGPSDIHEPMNTINIITSHVSNGGGTVRTVIAPVPVLVEEVAGVATLAAALLATPEAAQLWPHTQPYFGLLRRRHDAWPSFLLLRFVCLVGLLIVIDLFARV